MVLESFKKIKQGLAKTRSNILTRVQSLLGSNNSIDSGMIDQIEELLIESDIGIEMTEEILERVNDLWKEKGSLQKEELFSLLQEEISSSFADIPHSYSSENLPKPFVILVVGVNGSGKTTTIGKLAYWYKSRGRRVLLAAADTYRAAAQEQLDIWKKRAGVDIIQSQRKADPAAVVFDSLNAASARNIDVVIIDTAGRLHTKINLMEELKKIVRVIRRFSPEAPHETILVLDANIGQNSITQAKEFLNAVPVTGIAIAKLDGTAKGGTLVPISQKLKIPIRYIGLGEQVVDLEEFDPQQFTAALFSEEE